MKFLQHTRRAALILLATFSTAQAQDIEVLLDGDFSDTTGLNPNTVKGELDSAIQSQLNLGEQTEYLSQMSRASAMASRGMGVDYFVQPKRLIIGGSLGSAGNGAGLMAPGDSIMPQGGFAWQFAGMAGLNLGALSMKDTFARRFVIYANAMALERNRDPFTAASSNQGAHLQIRLVKPRQFATMEWGGLALTGGYERAVYEMSLTQAATVDAGGISWQPVGSYTIRSVSEAVPIELSSSIRVLFFGAFGGVALDVPLNAGATSEISLDGDIYTDVQGNQVNVGRATVGLDNEAITEELVTRFFAGAQVKLAVVHGYTHLNVSTDKSVGLHMGVRIGI
jgi:hypothetical protein